MYTPNVAAGLWFVVDFGGLDNGEERRVESSRD
jgi:hypothetical protein